MKVIDLGLAIPVIIKRYYLNLDIKDLAFFPLFYFFSFLRALSRLELRYPEADD